MMESCGNIYMHQAQERLIIICNFCARQYVDMQDFSEHLRDSHKLFTAAATAAEDTLPQSEVQKSRSKSINGKTEDSEEMNATVDVKTELAELSNPLEQILEPLESCGNISILDRQKIFLICGYCESKYTTVEFFIKHLRLQHQLYKEPAKETLVEPKLENKESLVELKQEVKVESLLEKLAQDAVPQKSVLMGTVPPEAIPQKDVVLEAFSIKKELQVDVLETTQQPLSLDAELKCENELRDVQIKAEKDTASLTISNATTIEGSDYEFSIEENQEDDAVSVHSAHEYEKRLPPKYDCDQCFKTFNHRTRFREHKRMHTGEKPFKCAECGKKFRIKNQMVVHAMRHRTEKVFKCNLCDHAARTKQDLTLHLRHHNGDKRHTCEHCSKAFVRGSDLKIHVRIHTGEKPYICEICNKAFRANQNLIVHRKMHRDEKAFKCDFCDKHFIRNIDRKLHHRTHTGEKNFKCEICNRFYISAHHVRRHTENMHGLGELRIRQKPGPKPKKPNESSDKGKLEKSVVQKKQEKSTVKRSPRLNSEKQQDTIPKVIKIEKISHKESIHEDSKALIIKLDDVENDAVVGRQRSRRKVRQITSYFTDLD